MASPGIPSCTQAFSPSHTAPQLVLVDHTHHGQRLDNFLIATVKNVPRPRLYRAIRSGEVRLNGKRSKPSCRLADGDQVRLPPFSAPERTQVISLEYAKRLEERIVYEDADLLVLDKPCGMPVHGGSGHSHGLIEQLSLLRPEIQLAHRLDRPTSGCLLIAKHRQALLLLHDLIKQRLVSKHYLTLVVGHWPETLTTIDTPVARHPLSSAERTACRDALTHFLVMERFDDYTLVQATPITGRMHQIRLHTASAGHPIAGDREHGYASQNRAIRLMGLQRLFLHAWILEFPWQGTAMTFRAPWPAALTAVLQRLRTATPQSDPG